MTTGWRIARGLSGRQDFQLGVLARFEAVRLACERRQRMLIPQLPIKVADGGWADATRSSVQFCIRSKVQISEAEASFIVEFYRRLVTVKSASL